VDLDIIGNGDAPKIEKEYLFGSMTLEEIKVSVKSNFNFV
jgi:hypothetical protein